MHGFRALFLGVGCCICEQNLQISAGVNGALMELGQNRNNPTDDKIAKTIQTEPRSVGIDFELQKTKILNLVV